MCKDEPETEDVYADVEACFQQIRDAGVKVWINHLAPPLRRRSGYYTDSFDVFIEKTWKL